MKKYAWLVSWHFISLMRALFSPDTYQVYQCQDVGLVEIHRATQNRKTAINVFLNIEPYSSWVPLSEHGHYASEVPSSCPKIYNTS